MTTFLARWAGGFKNAGLLTTASREMMLRFDAHWKAPSA